MSLAGFVNGVCKNDITSHIDDLDDLLRDFLPFSDEYEDAREALDKIREMVR